MLSLYTLNNLQYELLKLWLLLAENKLIVEPVEPIIYEERERESSKQIVASFLKINFLISSYLNSFLKINLNALFGINTLNCIIIFIASKGS